MFRKIRFNGKMIILHFLISLLVCFTMLPLIYMVVTAFKPLDELFIFPPRFYVSNPTMRNFATLLQSIGSVAVPFSRFVFNSVFTSASAVTLSVVVCSMGAYAISKLHLAHSKILFAIIVSALMFGTHVTQIPSYMIVKELGMLNRYSALIVPKIAIAYHFFLMKQFMDQLPVPILESARMDGANEWNIFWRIVMPVVKPAWATVVMFAFVANWNDYFSPLIFINRQAMKTLPLALQLISEQGNIARMGAIAAATLLTTLPSIIIFMIMQSKVNQTMAYSGIKA